MSEELKSCPFCGSRVSFISDPEGFYPTGIQCGKCHMVVRFTRIKPPGMHEKYERIMNELTEAWNKRDGEDA